MKKLALAFMATVLLGGCACGARKAERPVPADMKLVWADEFDQEGAPDPAKWKPEVGMLRNNELQYYTENRPENARVEAGNLVIEARKEKWEKADYTSASLTTSTKSSWIYGRFEVRAKIPRGRGMWPAIWMLGDSIGTVGWPTCGELDIMENVGFDHDRIVCSAHTRDFNHVKGTQRSGSLEVKSPSDDFHVYSMDWAPGQISFWFDDKLVYSFPKKGLGEGEWPFDLPEYLIMNIAVGGGWGGQKGVDDSVFPQKMLVDYVRVYQRNP